MMLPHESIFRRSILRQIEINRARTPHQRFMAFCELMQAAEAMAPQDAAAQERRRRAVELKQRERERSRAEWKRWIAEQRARDLSGV